MKKIIAFVLVAVMVATMAVSVFAADDTASFKEKIAKYIEEYTLDINGNKLAFKSTDVQAAKNFLDSFVTGGGEITQEMYDAVVNNIGKAADVVLKSKADIKELKDLSKLSADEKTLILEDANAAVKAFKLTVKFNSADGKVHYLDAAEKDVFVTEPTIIKKTDSSVNALPIVAVSAFAVVAVIGCAVIVKKYALSK